MSGKQEKKKRKQYRKEMEKAAGGDFKLHCAMQGMTVSKLKRKLWIYRIAIVLIVLTPVVIYAVKTISE